MICVPEARSGTETLVSGFPLLTAHITDVQVLLTRRIVGHVNYITLLPALIGRTGLLRAGNHLDMRQSIVLASELVDHNLECL